MRSKLGILFVSCGAVLILAALLLLGYNHYESAQAGKESENLLEQMQNIMSQNTPVSHPDTEIPQSHSGSGEAGPAEMPKIDIGNYTCIGYLSLPTLHMELPILTDWDYEKLKTAPCRQFGSVRTDDLVIAGHDYWHHFKQLNQLQLGDPVSFTEADGTLNQYQVEELRILEANDVDTVANSGYDLVL